MFYATINVVQIEYSIRFYTCNANMMCDCMKCCSIFRCVCLYERGRKSQCVCMFECIIVDGSDEMACNIVDSPKIYVLFSILKNSPTNTFEKLHTYASHTCEVYDANKSTHWYAPRSIHVYIVFSAKEIFSLTSIETQSIHKLFISSNKLWNYSVDISNK